MRKLPVAIAVSVALHGAAIAYVRTRPAPVVVAIQPVTHVTVEIKEPDPVAVTLLPDDMPAVASGAVATGRMASGVRPQPSGTPHVTTGRPGTTETAPAEPSKPHSALMSMRQPTIERGPSSGFMERFLANSKPLQPKEIASEQRADEIASLESDLRNPAWVANHTGEQVVMAHVAHAALRDEQAHAELQPDGRGTKAAHTTFTEKFEPDGSVHISDEKNFKWQGLGGSFDVSDWAMRSQGIDPYASAKLRALDNTRDERVAIGNRYRHQLLGQSRQLVQKNLAFLWQKTRGASERKQALFEMWDEIAETGEPDVVAGGADARAYLVGFIRARFPAGSADAFTADELARLNAHRRSKQEFAPY